MEINSLLSSKKGKLYLRFVIAAAVVIALASALHTLAANPSATPRIVTGQNSTIGENATVAKATEQLFGYANILTIVLSLPSLRSVSFTNTNGTFEENSTFKWFKRTLYQPQNRSLVGYWKMDGNANDFFRYWNKIFNRRVRIL